MLASPQSTGAVQVFVSVTTTLILRGSAQKPVVPGSNTAGTNKPPPGLDIAAKGKDVTNIGQLNQNQGIGKGQGKTPPQVSASAPTAPPLKPPPVFTAVKQVTPYFLGWGELPPRPSIDPHWNGIKGDVRGGGHGISNAPDQDDLYLGQDSEILAVPFTVWDEDVLQYIERFVTFSSNGTDSYYDTGTLAIAEQQTYH